MNLKHLKKYISNLSLIDDLRKHWEYRLLVIKIEFVSYCSLLFYLAKTSKFKGGDNVTVSVLVYDTLAELGLTSLGRAYMLALYIRNRLS